MERASQGRVEAIWLKRAVGGPMDPVHEAIFVEGEGIVDDVNRGRSHRHVTVIEKEVFDGIRATLPDADPAMRRANMMVSGIRLAKSRHHVLRVGDARLRLSGQTRPCERMDEQCDGLTAALKADWGGGAYGVVIEGGAVRVGDAVVLESPAGDT